jgi:hypothetical protein
VLLSMRRRSSCAGERSTCGLLKTFIREDDRDKDYPQEEKSDILA